MHPPTIARRTRRAFALSVVGALALAATALAGPTQDVSTANDAGTQVGTFWPAGTAIYGSKGSTGTWSNGHGAYFSFCNGFGANTRIVAADVTNVRWHTQSLNGSMYLMQPSGWTWSVRSDAMPVGAAMRAWRGVVLNPGECGRLGYQMQGDQARSSTWQPTFNAIVNAVRVEDLQGPAVGGLWTPAGWVTGDSVLLHWDHSDNGLFRGSTGARVAGGGQSDLGDPGNGRSGAWVPVGGLPDGPQTVVAYRTGGPWGAAEQGVGFNLDRNAPGVPTVSLSPNTNGGWTNQDVTVTSAATADGTGSGWHHNELSNGATNATMITAEGQTNISARAVDVAGHASAWSGAAAVRIDKTPPPAPLAIQRVSPGTVNLLVDLPATEPGGSGIARFEVRLGGADGPLVATTAQELLNVGSAAPAKDAGNVRFHLKVWDRAGNSSETTSAITRLDAIAPSAALDAAPAGWVNGFSAGAAGDNRLKVTVSDNLPDGVGRVEVQVRQGADAPWQVVRRFAPGELSQGTHIVDASLAGLSIVDGPAEVRVVAYDPVMAEQVGASPATRVLVDVTSPTAAQLTTMSALPVSGGQIRVSLPGLSDAASGLGRVSVFANTDPHAGSDPAKFAKVGEVSTPGASPTVGVDMTSFGSSGLFATKVVAVDAAGNVAEFPGPTVSLDQVAPTVGSPQVDGTGTLRFSFSDANGFGVCPTSVDISGPGTAGAWQRVFEDSVSGLAGNFVWQLPLDGMAAGEYQARVTVCDAAGNAKTQTTRFVWGAKAPGGPTADSRRPDLRDANVGDLAAPGGSTYRMVDGRRVPVVRIAYGKRFSLAGRLTMKDGSPIVGVAVELRDSLGRHQAGTQTDAAGRFILRARGLRGGKWTIAAIGTPEKRTGAILEVIPTVKARVRVRASGGGQRLVVTGSLIPKAGAYGKGVQLQWKDRGTWRPIANRMVARSGRFSFTYRFRKRGYSVAVRVAVPREKGWAFEPTTSRPVTVRVR